VDCLFPRTAEEPVQGMRGPFWNHSCTRAHFNLATPLAEQIGDDMARRAAGNWMDGLSGFGVVIRRSGFESGIKLDISQIVGTSQVLANR